MIQSRCPFCGSPQMRCLQTQRALVDGYDIPVTKYECYSYQMLTEPVKATRRSNLCIEREQLSREGFYPYLTYIHRGDELAEATKGGAT